MLPGGLPASLGAHKIAFVLLFIIYGLSQKRRGKGAGWGLEVTGSWAEDKDYAYERRVSSSNLFDRCSKGACTDLPCCCFSLLLSSPLSLSFVLFSLLYSPTAAAATNTRTGQSSSKSSYAPYPSHRRATWMRNCSVSYQVYLALLLSVFFFPSRSLGYLSLSLFLFLSHVLFVSLFVFASIIMRPIIVMALCCRLQLMSIGIFHSIPFCSVPFHSAAGAFRLYDVDNDGYITREEMYNIVDAIYQMVVSVMTLPNDPLNFPYSPYSPRLSGSI